MTECNQLSFGFHVPGRRRGIARFNGGTISSDGGGLLLSEVERRTGILRRFADCFTDHRDGDRIEHRVYELIAQRIYGLALGYEDLNDHDDLRHDPLLAAMVGKADPTGRHRSRRRDRGKALAGKSTLNRLELTPVGADAASRYKKIIMDTSAVETLLAELFLDAHRRPPDRIVLDLDATDDPVHGDQSGRFFHGYYGHYCYLPLYVFCGEHLLCARLRPSNIDASAGSVKQLERIVGQVRRRWPRVQIVIRGDSGFCREHIMAWCERQEVDYILGIARNERLTASIAEDLEQARQTYEQTGRACRLFKDFAYQTRKTWSRPRRVIGKAEHLSKGPNPRFVVTSIGADRLDARALYEQHYCARGDMENRIKEQQLGLFADRTSAATMRANQLRLYLSSIAYTLMAALRRLGLRGTSMAKAQCTTIRATLLKIGAQVRVTCRRVWVALSQSYPHQDLLARIWTHLSRAGPVPV